MRSESMQDQPTETQERSSPPQPSIIEGTVVERRENMPQRRLFATMRKLLPRSNADNGSEAATLWLRVPTPPGYGTTLILFVILPSIAYALYLFLLASDQYMSEARFAIHSSQVVALSDSGSTSSSSSAGNMGAPSLAGQEAFVVADYIRSAAILGDIGSSIDVKAIYNRPEIDFYSRLGQKVSRERLLDYWKGKVATFVDGPSGTVTVTVRAFRQVDARDLLQAIISASEKLVNGMSQRVRDDAMASAETEVSRAEMKLRDALNEMRTFQEKVGFLSPETAAASTSKLLLEAMSEKLKLENDYFVSLQAMSPTAPSVVAQKSRLDALTQQIDRLKANLTGNGKGTEGAIATSISEYERLELQRVFAEKMYDLSTRALERARQRAEQQAVYLSVFVPPLIPEEASFPRRIPQSLLLPVGLLILWGILALLVATIEDHNL